MILAHRLLCVLLLCTLFGSVQAEIYKWQDENGGWHFSDNPLDVPGNKQQTFAAKKTKNKPQSKDLKEQLHSKYNPTSTIETMTLAVVGIETPVGQGSGFFISDEGHIVTNKHVIRPMEDDNEQVEEFERRERKLTKIERRLDDERAYLERYSNQLEDYKEEVYARSESDESIAVQEYLSYEKRYLDRLNDYKSQQRLFDKRKKDLTDAKSDFVLKTSMARAARSFTVYLKDNTKLKARLLQLSKDHDLALLKLEGYKTPKLERGNERAVRQGSRVFAIGSPLGMRDSMTSGIIARLQVDYLVTDAQILPGNSGGPLLNEEGEVIGVNTQKFAKQVMEEGFGLAIPISVVEKEFGFK